MVDKVKDSKKKNAGKKDKAKPEAGKGKSGQPKQNARPANKSKPAPNKTKGKEKPNTTTATKGKGKDVVHTMYMNGIFSRNNPEKFNLIKAELVKLFGGTCEQVHNKTLSIDSKSKEAKNFVKEHPMYVFMSGLSTYPVLAGKLGGVRKKIIDEALAKTLTPMRLALEKHAASESGKLWQALSKKVKETEKLNDKEPVDSLTINIYAHSHGGMVVDELLKGEAFLSSLKNKWLPKMKFDFKIRFFIAGCPIIVRSPGVKFATLKQLDNLEDFISLCFFSKKKVPGYVISKKLGKTHKSLVYAKNLKILL